MAIQTASTVKLIIPESSPETVVENFKVPAEGQHPGAHRTPNISGVLMEVMNVPPMPFSPSGLSRAIIDLMLWSCPCQTGPATRNNDLDCPCLLFVRPMSFGRALYPGCCQKGFPTPLVNLWSHWYQTWTYSSQRKWRKV